MDNLIVKANLIRRSANDMDVNMLMVGNNVIMVTSDILNNIIVTPDSKYELIKDSSGKWAKDKETGIEYNVELLKNDGWNNCLNYLLEHIDDFHDTLAYGAYDYFPISRIEEYLKSLIKKRVINIDEDAI